MDKDDGGLPFSIAFIISATLIGVFMVATAVIVVTLTAVFGTGG